MIDAFYTAAVGTNQIQKGFDVLSNNIANVSTAGFKRSKSSFADLLYTNIRASETETNLKVGHGAKLEKTDVLHTQGMFQQTERQLDYAIEGNGYFGIETTDGIKYTRCGNFEMSEIGGKFYLTATQGGYVLDSKGKRIEVKNTQDNFDIGVYEFKNTDGLKIEGGLFFNPTEISGQATAIKEPSLKRGFLEGSNVDMAQSMSDVIELQRAFQFNARMVQMSDEVMQTVNSLR